jgi:hypothetical protein
MTIYCGVDFHARQQTTCYCDAADGQVHLKGLRHEGEDTRAFYSELAGEVIVGLEASGYSTRCCRVAGGPRPSGTDRAAGLPRQTRECGTDLMGLVGARIDD